MSILRIFAKVKAHFTYFLTSHGNLCKFVCNLKSNNNLWSSKQSNHLFHKFFTQFGSAIYGLGLDFPLKTSNFLIFPSGQKKSLWIGSKSTRVKGWMASYFCGSKLYARVGSRPISNIIPDQILNALSKKDDDLYTYSTDPSIWSSKVLAAQVKLGIKIWKNVVGIQREAWPKKWLQFVQHLK